MARILIIDDDPAVRATARMALTACGHVVSEARHGAEGIKRFHTLQPALVITDIVMPEMDGIEVLMKLRALKAGVKVIAISRGGQQSAVGYLRAAGLLGAEKFLTKPFTCEALLGPPAVVGAGAEANLELRAGR